MRRHGGPQRLRPVSAHREDHTHAGHQAHGESCRRAAKVKSRRISPHAVKVEIDQSEQDGTYRRANPAIELPRKGLLDEPAEKKLFADRIQEDRRQRIQGKKTSRRKDAAHFVEVEVVAEADAPVIRRVPEDRYPQHEKPDGTRCSGKSAQQERREGWALIGQADFAAPTPREEDEWERPHGNRLQEEDMLHLPRTEKRYKPDRCNCRVEQQRNHPWRTDEFAP